MTMTTRTRTAIATLLLAAFGLLLMAFLLVRQSLIPQPDAFIARGKFDPPPTMPDFTLTDQDGAALKLSSLRGQAVMLFFGYTHCPDVCPLTMAQFRAVKSALGDDAKQTAFVMISVDGTRDTPEVMKQFVRTFDAGFIGLTGNEDSVQTIGKDYGVESIKPTPDPSHNHDPSYIVGHTPFSYLLDTQGRKRFIYKSDTPIEVMVADIQQVLRETSTAR